MNILRLLILMIVSNLACIAQNLVPNPSFEDSLQCPNFPQPTIDYALYWSSYNGTPDFYNSCANNISLWGVPENFLGYQNPYHGDSYAGLITWTVLAANKREYMGIQLTSPLNIGTKYYVSFYTSNGDSATANGNAKSSSNNLGVKFSTIPYVNYILLQNNSAHVYEDSIITDKINWIKISGSFIADSAYQYLILGNFFDDQNTLVDTLPPFANATAYYYIDAVVVSTDSLTSVGIDEIEHKEDFKLFPNPFNDKINIATEISETLEIAFYDLTGRNLLNNRFSRAILLNTESLEKGIYIYIVSNKSEIIRTGKVVKY